jgi:hypothetical protein
MAFTARAKACSVVVLYVVLASEHNLQAQFAGPPRADSAVRYLISRMALRDTTGIILPFEEASLASQGIGRDSLLHLLLVGFDIGRVQKAEVIDRTEFHPFNATRIDEQLAYHVVGQRDSRLVFVAATSDSGNTSLTGIRWQQAPADLRQMNPFRFAGKSWLHYTILTLAVLIPLFSIGTAVVAALSRGRFKWVWAVVSLISIGKIGIAWTDSSAAGAAVRFTPINLQLLGAGVLKYPLYAPWVISIGLPVFALAYWILGRPRPAKSPAPQSVAA